MKCNISDLLDDYEEDGIDLRGEALSMERVKELTMKKMNGQRTKRRFAPARVLLIAAVVTAITCSALAVGYTLKAGDWFKDFFGTAETPITTEQREVLNDIGATFDGSVTSNGTTVTPVAAIADENIYYLRLRIEAPEGTVLPEYNNEVDGWYQLSGQTLEERCEVIPDDDRWGGYYGAIPEWLPDDNPADNVKEVVVRILASPGMGTDFTDGSERTFYFKGLWLQSPDKIYTQILSGNFKIDMGRYESQIINLDCEGLSWYYLETDCTMHLRTLSLSPLSLAFSYTYTGINNTRYSDWVGPLEVVMKDGTKADLGNVGPGGGRDLAFHSYYVFTVPLDLTQVDYVMYGDQRIDLPE